MIEIVEILNETITGNTLETHGLLNMNLYKYNFTFNLLHFLTVAT